MTPKCEMFLRVLMNKYHQAAPEALLSGLPPEQAQAVLNVDNNSQDVSQAVIQSKEIVKHIHYSWLVPIIEGLSPQMQPLFLSSLPSVSSQQLSKILKKPLHSTPLSPAVRLFLVNQLYAKIKPIDVLPVSYLPQTSMTVLLNYKKLELVELIDFLGLYDLAEEIRHIVDKRYLKAIYNGLSIKKQHFLRICLHHKEKLLPPRLGLEKWKGDSRELEKLLHQRGLIRLGKALAGQHPDLVWHLSHRLDTGRGRLIQKYYAKEEIPGITQALIQEILNLLNFFRKMSEK